MNAALSIVVPVYNEAAQELELTLRAAGAAARAAPWREAEIVVVDDGSDPPVGAPQLEGLEVRVVRQPNSGRFAARRAGIEAARGDYVLLLDARVTLEPTALSWVAEQVAEGRHAWNGHCLMARTDNPYARFWNVLTHAAFSEYLDAPRTTSFGLEEYDRFPKGTGHFLAPRAWLLEAIGDFSSRYEDTRFASDDTHLLRAIAERDRIHISPSFASAYRNRDALGPFLRHALHRGTTFFDGFARPGTRFFGVVVAAFPLSVGGTALALARPRAAATAAAALAAAGGAYARRRGRPQEEALAFAVLLPPFAVAYAAGVWRGAWLALSGRRRR